MNYQELVQAIQGYAENTFPDTLDFESQDQIDSFIRSAEQKIYTHLQMPALKANMVGRAEQGNRFLSLPNDFLAFESVSIVMSDGTYKILVDKDESFIREHCPNPNFTGVPEYIGIFGPDARGTPIAHTTNTAAIMAPTPDKDYEIELHYFYIPASISDTVRNPSGETWLGTNYSSLLLYGCLLEAGMFMQLEGEYMEYLRSQYEEALGLVSSLNRGRAVVGAYRSR